MKKNQGLVLLAALVVMTQLGFDWGMPPSEKKAAPVQSSSASTGSGQTASVSNAEVPFPQMMGALTQNMTLWLALSQENKKKAVEAATLFYRERQNSAILRSADFYVEQIDLGMKANPSLQGTDLMSILKMMAVMQYDFYNGQDKDALAKEVLGEKMYESIRARRQ